MNECCENLETKFCPTCGEPINPPPLCELRRHIQRTIQVRKKELVNAQYKMTRISEKLYHHETQRTIDEKYEQRKIDSANRAIEKWTAWNNALCEIIK
jgi:uncharacterized Zn finger protein (UPF0148 family)